MEAIIKKAKIQRTEAEALIKEEKIKHEAALEELNNFVQTKANEIAQSYAKVMKQTEENYTEKESAFFSSIDSKLEEYKKDAMYRLQRLDTVESDISNIETQLRKSMSDAEKRVEDDFKTFIETQQNNQSEFANSFNKNSEKLDNQMNNLEVELNALK